MSQQQVLLSFGTGGGGFAVGGVTLGEFSAATVWTFAHTTSGSNRALIVVVANHTDGAAPTSVKYNTVAMTSVGSQADPGADDSNASIWKLSNPASGSNDIEVTFAAATQGNARGVTFTGAHQTTASLTGTFTGAQGTSTTPTVDISSAAGEIVIDCTAPNHAGVTPGAGQTERAPPSVFGGACSTEPGTTTVTMSWTQSPSGYWAIGGVSVKPA